jgi:hypothetical protein
VLGVSKINHRLTSHLKKPKHSSRASRSEVSLTEQRILQIQTILVLTVDYRIKVHMDLQEDKSTVVVKGPFFPRAVNPRYRIR